MRGNNAYSLPTVVWGVLAVGMAIAFGLGVGVGLGGLGSKPSGRPAPAPTCRKPPHERYPYDSARRPS